MERPRRPYSLNKRPTTEKNRFIYYVRFRNPETGVYLSAVSSGMTNKPAASNWADDQIRRGKIILPGKRNVTFDDFARDFWNFEKSEYIRGKLARGQQIGRSHAKISAGYVERHILPYFEGRSLASIRTFEIEKWMLSLLDAGELSPKSINLVFAAFRTILREAFRAGYIPTDPTAQVRPLSLKPVERGILSPDEVRRLFDEATIPTVWKGSLRNYTANLLAVATGMREGEIRALQVANVHLDYVEVVHSWEQGFGLKGAKWNSERIVPIPSKVSAKLAEVIEASPYKEPEDLVFFGPSRCVPMHSKLFTKPLYRALGSIGIDENARRDRNLTFHGLRHFFNSICRGRVPDSKLQRVTGHRTLAMTELYTHSLGDDFNEVRAVQESLF